MHKLVTLPTMLALSIGLVACANQPNQNLEEARSSFSALQSDARSSKVAALETQDASNMLDKANSSKAKMGITNVEFRQGQIEALPVDDNSIDVILSNCVINLSPDKSAVFAEAFRVLKPGGRVSISDIVTEGEFSDELRADTAKWADCVTGAISIDAYTGLMRAAGFVDIEVVNRFDATGIVDQEPGMPTIISARITATKPASA